MQINFKLTVAEASEMARETLNRRWNGVQNNIGKVEIESPVADVSMSNRQVSGQNKIWLIKLIRQLSCDIDKGDVKICKNNSGGTGISSGIPVFNQKNC